MTNFNKALTRILENEGGFSKHPNDPGGATNYGISSKFLNQHYKIQYDKNHNGVVDVADM